jgi:prophage regulatory protein
MTITLSRLPDVLRRTGRSRASHYDDIVVGVMVPPIRIGIRAVAYPDHEVDAIIRARVAGRSADEIRHLVMDMVAARVCADAA